MNKIKIMVDSLRNLNPLRVVDDQVLICDFQGGMVALNRCSNRLIRNRLIAYRKRNRIGVNEWCSDEPTVNGIPYGMVDILLHECARRKMQIIGKMMPKSKWSK